VPHAAVLAACAGALVLAFLLEPEAEGLSLFGCRWPWYCSLHEVFGIKCALCGLTRSFCHVAQGNLVAAVQHHRLGPLVFTLFCLEVPYRAYAIAVSPRRIGASIAKGHATLVALVVAAVVVNWLLYLGEFVV
jgi:hypothetical protein